MTTRTMRYAAVAALLAAACGAAEINRGTFGDIEVSLVPCQYEELCHGYAQHEARVVNKSLSCTHAVVLRMGTSRTYGGLSSIERGISVGPGAQVTVSLLQPSLQFSCDAMEVYVDGQRGTFDVQNAGRSFYGYYGNDIAPRVLTSRRINNDNIAEHFIPTNSTRYGYAREHWRFVKSEREAAEWTGEWLAYSCFDGVVLLADDYRELSPATRSALDGYVRCGGVLTVLGKGAADLVGKGFNFATINGMAIAKVGFGCIVAVDTPVPDKLSGDHTEAISNAWISSLAACRKMDVDDAMRKMPVTDTIKVPVGMMTLTIIGFSILVGPVNLLVLSRIKRRIWMLWTIPAIALGTSALIWIHAFVSEGVTPTVRIEGVTLLDQRVGIAASIGLEGCYCPLTPGGGLQFSATTEATPLWTRDNATRSVDWTRGQHLKGAWVAARVPTYFMVRKCETRRERLQVSRTPDGAMRVINGLGASVSNLYLVDTTGVVFFVDHIAAGAEKVLSRTSRPAAPYEVVPESILRDLARDYSNMCEGKYLRGAASRLRPNMYLAQLDGAPFLDEMFEGKSHRSARSVVCGTYEPDAGTGGGNAK